MRFAFEGPINLGAASVAVNRLLDETGGTGELVEGTDGAALLPIVLAPKPGATWSEVSYETPAGEIPQVRVKMVVAVATVLHQRRLVGDVVREQEPVAVSRRDQREDMRHAPAVVRRVEARLMG